MQDGLIRASAGQWGAQGAGRGAGRVREDGSGDVQNGMPAPRLVVWRITSGQRERALVEGRGEVASASYNLGPPSALGSPLIRIPGPSLQHHPAFCTKFTAN